MINKIVNESVVMGPFEQKQFYHFLITKRMLIMSANFITSIKRNLI